MLKKIATTDLRAGMYVQRLCGSWLDHPFWKKHFLVDAKALAQLRGSGIKDVWIDTAKGVDVVEPIEPDHVGTVIETEHEPDAGPAATMEPQACSLAEELSRAATIVGQARGAMKAMFEEVRLGQAIHAEHCMPLVNDITASVSATRVPSSASHDSRPATTTRTCTASRSAR